MKDYTVESPVFSEKISITETTDAAHADNINAASKQLLENTLANRESIAQVEEKISNVDNTADADKSVSYATTAGTADTATSAAYATSAGTADTATTAGTADTATSAAYATSAGTADTATSAGTLTTARAIDGVSFDGSAAVTHYGTCSTAAATAAKTVSVSNFTLVTGARVLVRFSYANTASSPTLNVNGTGAKSIRYRNAAVPASYIQQYGVYEFVYSGTYWYIEGDMTGYRLDQVESAISNVDNTADADKSVSYATTAGTADTATEAGAANAFTTARAIDGVSFDGSAAVTHYGTCSTAAATAAKEVSVANFTLVTGARVLVRFSYTNTASSPTLNVNGTGAKYIRYRNAAVPVSYIRQYGVYEFVYGGSYWYLTGDVTYYLYSQLSTSLAAIRSVLWTGLSTSVTLSEAEASGCDTGIIMVEGIFTSSAEESNMPGAYGRQVFLLGLDTAANNSGYYASAYISSWGTFGDVISIWTDSDGSVYFTSTKKSSDTRGFSFYFSRISVLFA